MPPASEPALAPPFRTDGARGFRVTPGAALRGTAHVPGDKSLSHRALILSALAEGTILLHGLNSGDDVARTRNALRAMGTPISTAADGALRVHGSGAVREPAHPIDCGNSGTALRLLAGVAAGIDGLTILSGDESLGRRPVDRVIAPLTRMGARCDARAGGTRPPLVIRGGALHGARIELPIASAQVKSAVLLAALRAPGLTEVREPHRSRDHTERMLRAFGAPLAERADGALALEGPCTLTVPPEGALHVPGDPSAAAFLVVGALLCPGSDVRVENVCLNPTRTGWIEVLRRMGGDVEVEQTAVAAGEPVGTIRARTSELRAADIAPEEVPALVDEAPILAVAQARAAGRSTLRGAADLRVKESDRIATVTAAVRAMGGTADTRPDGWVIEGGALRGGAIAGAGDHRIAMAFAMAALAAGGETTIDEHWAIATSFPAFFATVAALAG